MANCPICGSRLKNNICIDCGYEMPDEKSISALYNYDPSDDIPERAPTEEYKEPEYQIPEISVAQKNELAPRPAQNASPYAQNPAQNASPYAQNPAQNASPYAQNPAQNASPYAQNPAQNASPYAQNPAQNASPYAQNPAQNASPYAQNPAQNASPYDKNRVQNIQPSAHNVNPYANMNTLNGSNAPYTGKHVYRGGYTTPEGQLDFSQTLTDFFKTKGWMLFLMIFAPWLATTVLIIMLAKNKNYDKGAITLLIIGVFIFSFVFQGIRAAIGVV